MKKKNFKKLVNCNGNQFFDAALTSHEMNAITGGTSGKKELNNIDSCGCHSCANLCCSGFGSGGTNLG